MKKLRLAAVLFVVSSFHASGNTFADDQSQQTSKVPERLDITFDYQRGGIASSQYAIWVEDTAGKPVRTIFIEFLNNSPLKREGFLRPSTDFSTRSDPA